MNRRRILHAHRILESHDYSNFKSAMPHTHAIWSFVLAATILSCTLLCDRLSRSAAGTLRTLSLPFLIFVTSPTVLRTYCPSPDSHRSILLIIHFLSMTCVASVPCLAPFPPGCARRHAAGFREITLHPSIRQRDRRYVFASPLPQSGLVTSTKPDMSLPATHGLRMFSSRRAQ